MFFALALGVASAARAVPVSFDVSGAAGSWVTLSSFATDPCTMYPGEGRDLCSTHPLSAGSSLEIDITGNVVTLLASELSVEADLRLFGIVTLHLDLDMTLSGGTGTLNGRSILWTSPTAYAVEPDSSLTCTDLGPAEPVTCGTLGLVADTPFPYSTFLTMGNLRALETVDLQDWVLSEDRTEILYSTRVITTVRAHTPGFPGTWLFFGRDDLGFLPEPGAFLLGTLGLAGLALRLRLR